MAEINEQTYTTVLGYFASEQSAEAAIRALHAAGFRRDQIGIAWQPESDQALSGDRSNRENSSYQEGRKAGHAVGGFWERVRNFFEGNAAEPYADEPTRGDLATREITSSDTTGDYESPSYDYDSSDFHRSLGGLSVPEERSRYFSDRFGRDKQGVLVTVQAGDRRGEAETILKENGADMGREGDSTFTRSDAAAQASTSSAAEIRQSQRIQLYGEVLRVHRDRIQRGEVRLRKETITENQTVQVPVTREELVLERTPVSGDQAANPAANFGQDSEIRIPLSEDRVSVEKQPVIREEVQVGKREVTNVEQREEQVRREELRVDDETERKAG